MSNNILIVDDQQVILDILSEILKEKGYTIHSAKTAAEGLEQFSTVSPDAVFLDIMLPDRSGLEVLDLIHQQDPTIPVIIITAFSSIENAIDAMRRGAYHYIPKPFKNQEVILTLKKALEDKQIRAENLRLKSELKEKFSFGNIIGKSEPMQKVFELIQLAAPSSSTILIKGESGTGKELVSKSIHHHSKRSDAPIVVVNSGNIAPELLESHLFGHERGSFTGAHTRKKGLFEIANHGTIFFDEIGNVNPDTQVKLLRVMQEKEFMRLGGTEIIRVDVRFIAATNENLEQLVQEKAFREDFYYRLNVISIELPPLRNRKEDIPLLTDHFIKKFGQENQKENLKVSESVMKIFMDYPWPGNVRELENAVERAVVLTKEQVIQPDVLPQQLLQPNRIIFSHGSLPDGLTLQEATEEFQRQIILQALHSAGGVQRKAARQLKVKPNTLNVMLKRLNIKI